MTGRGQGGSSPGRRWWRRVWRRCWNCLPGICGRRCGDGSFSRRAPPMFNRLIHTLLVGLVVGMNAASAGEPVYRSELIFPLNPKHNHAPGIAELPDGELVVSWYRGSGERSADDVAVYGSRLKPGAKEWAPDALWV